MACFRDSYKSSTSGMTYTTNLYILMSVSVTLTLIEGHRVTGKLELRDQSIVNGLDVARTF